VLTLTRLQLLNSDGDVSVVDSVGHDPQLTQRMRVAANEVTAQANALTSILAAATRYGLVMTVDGVIVNTATGQRVPTTNQSQQYYWAVVEKRPNITESTSLEQEQYIDLAPQLFRSAVTVVNDMSAIMVPPSASSKSGAMRLNAGWVSIMLGITLISHAFI